jgi:hypothetical protein
MEKATLACAERLACRAVLSSIGTQIATGGATPSATTKHINRVPVDLLKSHLLVCSPLYAMMWS